MIDLYADPIHVPTGDSHTWIELFKAVIKSNKITLSNFDRVKLLHLLHDFRGIGTVIQGGKLAPLIHPIGQWESQEEYDEMKLFLEPYARELKILLQEVTQY